jgi:tRNA dimethylallyltransferase
LKDRAANGKRSDRARFFLMGATATGKSAVALSVARELGGEIIAVDSMQVYRGLDIGTAKATAAEQQGVRHHLLDIVDLAETFDASRFVAYARTAVSDIEGRGGIPIFCGGTGLYLKAYLEGLGEAPPTDPRLRAELEAATLTELLAELERADPSTRRSIDVANRRRVVRAVEVLRLSGRPPSALRAGWLAGGAAATSVAPPLVFGLARAGDDLRGRIERRVDAMFRAGLVEETNGLLSRGLARNRTAMQAIGYRQVVEHLEGARSLDATVALVKQKTWQLARRQRTWFRHQLPVQWLELSPASEPAAVAGALVERWRLVAR